jgi:hypothetical protein
MPTGNPRGTNVLPCGFRGFLRGAPLVIAFTASRRRPVVQLRVEPVCTRQASPYRVSGTSRSGRPRTGRRLQSHSVPVHGNGTVRDKDAVAPELSGNAIARIRTARCARRADMPEQALASRPAPEPLGKEFRHPLSTRPDHSPRRRPSSTGGSTSSRHPRKVLAPRRKPEHGRGAIQTGGLDIGHVTYLAEYGK